MTNMLKELSPEEFLLFKNWFKNVIIRGLPKDTGNDVSKIIEDSEEVDFMVYNLEKTLREELSKSREEGREVGREECREEAMKEMAIKLLDILDIETIALKTGLSVEEIKQLKH
jgi:predicted transposase/invertase (TIGR01784 family)